MLLRTKILLSLIAIAIIPLALFGAVAYITSTNNLLAVEQDALTSGLESASHAINETQATLARYLKDFAQWDELHDVSAKDTLDVDWVTANLDPNTPTSTYNTFSLDIIGLWNYQDKLLYSANLTPEILARLGSSITIAAVKSNPKASLLSIGGSIYVIAINAITTGDGKDPNGVLVFGRKLSSKDSTAITSLIGYEVAFYQGSNQIVEPRSTMPAPSSSDLSAMAQNNSYRFNQNGEAYAEAFAPIHNDQGESVGTLVMWRPRTALQASQNAITTTLIGAFIIGAALAAIVALLLGTSIVSPIIRMVETADKIASGDFTQRISVTGTSNDELGRLGNAFNRMTTQLAHTIDELKERVKEIALKNDALQKSNAKAEELARVRGEFLATMSHELRTPLNAIIGFSDVLLMGVSGELNPMQSHQVVRLKENGKRLLSLINDVLDISRIEAGRIEIVSEPFDPTALIDRIAAQTRVLAEQKQLGFTTEIDATLPRTFIGDEKRIEQIIVNLLSNAFKFTETGSVSFSVGIDVVKKTWSMRVKDTGIGIPPHALDLIFEPFRQVDGSSTRAYNGSGLGLAIAQQLANGMGGKITVESTIGSGSTFIVELPIQLPEQPNPLVAKTEGV